MTGGRVRTARGNHLQVWRCHKKVVLLLGSALLLPLGLMHTSTAEAIPLFKMLSLEPSAQTAKPQTTESNQDTPQFIAGPPTSRTAATINPTKAILAWSATGEGTTQDTYVLRIATTLDEKQHQLVNPIEHADLATTSFDASPLESDLTYYWQVRSCSVHLVCGDWSPVWSVTTDATAPAAPTAKQASGAHDQTLQLAGEAEPGSAVTMTVNDESAATCTANADTRGDWTCDFAAPLEYGDYTALVTATDAAGNVSSTSTLDFNISELFVAPQITAAELPSPLEITTINPQLTENKVFERPATTVIDTVNMGAATMPTNDTAPPSVPFSTEGGLIQSSDQGWRVLGLPWFVWLGGAGSLGGVWWALGTPLPRRLGGIFTL